MALSDGEIIKVSLVEPVRFAGIFDRHIDAIRRYVTRRLGQRGDDVVSEVFRIAFERRDTFRTEAGSALPWLYGIAANLVRRDRRSTSRGIAALERLGRRAPVTIDPLLDLDSRLDAENDVHDLRAALLSLREEEREVLLLVAWEELSPSEAAAVLGIDPQTARSRLHRARQHIRQQIERSELDQEVWNSAN